MSKKLSTCPSWQQTLWGYLALLRISNSPTVISNALVGAALAGVIWPDHAVVLVAVALMLLYMAGMCLSDVIDFTKDRRERTPRPLPFGILSPTMAATIAVSFFFIGSALLSSVSVLAFLCGLLFIVLIICYSLWHYENTRGSLFIALCRGMLYVTTFLVFKPHSLLAVLMPAALLMLYVIGLTSLALSTEGSRVFAIVIRMILVLPVVYTVWRAPLASFSLAFLFASWVAYSLFYRSKYRQRERVAERLLAGIALLDALWLAGVGSIAGVALALVAFVCTLFFQLYAPEF